MELHCRVQLAWTAVPVPTVPTSAYRRLVLYFLFGKARVVSSDSLPSLSDRQKSGRKVRKNADQGMACKSTGFMNENCDTQRMSGACCSMCVFVCVVCVCVYVRRK